MPENRLYNKRLGFADSREEGGRGSESFFCALHVGILKGYVSTWGKNQIKKAIKGKGSVGK